MLSITRRTLLAGSAVLPFLRGRGAQAARTPGVLTFGLSSYPPTIQPWANAGTAAVARELSHADRLAQIGGQRADRRRPVHAQGAGARRLARARGVPEILQAGHAQAEVGARDRLRGREPARRRAADRRRRSDRI